MLVINKLKVENQCTAPSAKAIANEIVRSVRKVGKTKKNKKKKIKRVGTDEVTKFKSLPDFKYPPN